jgi:hypothetical protein
MVAMRPRKWGAPYLFGLDRLWGKPRSPAALEYRNIRRVYSSRRSHTYPRFCSCYYQTHKSNAMADRAAKRMRRLSTEYEESEGADEWMNGNSR